jgi:hypothetical protein
VKLHLAKRALRQVERKEAWWAKSELGIDVSLAAEDAEARQ